MNDISPTCDGVKVVPSKMISGAIAVLDIVLTPFANTSPIPSPAATTSPLAPKPSTVNCALLRLDVAPVPKITSETVENQKGRIWHYFGTRLIFVVELNYFLGSL